MTEATITVPPRSEIPAEYTWNAPSVFESRQAWEAETKRILDSLPEIEKFKGHLGDNPKTLADALEKIDALFARIGKVIVYSGMSAAVDTTDQVAQALDSQANGLFGRVLAAVSFANPEMIKIGQDKLRQWMKQEPRLAIYEHAIDDLFRTQAHVRSEEVEEILGMVQDPFSTVYTNYSVLTNADMKFSEVKPGTGQPISLVQGNLEAMLRSPDREIRRGAWENCADSYLAFKNTMTSNLSMSVKQDVFRARARRYNSSLEAALFPNNIPTTVFNNLIDVFKRNLPTWHKYWAIRRRALGTPDLHPYDIWAPLVKDQPHVPYNQAVDWICEGMAPLGDEYINTLRRGCLQDRWVDIYPNQGKQSGAFSSGWKGTHPFIMMSYSDSLESMSTLAHELGHSMHSFFTWQQQPMTYANYSLFVAEVASNFNQAMVRAHLLEQDQDRNFQIAVIEEAMNNFHRYFFIMPTLARFELEFHERLEQGNAPGPDDLINLMADLFSEGYGNEMHVDRPRVGITWAQFGHLYQGYYVFQYATGISAAHALSQRVRSGQKGAAEDYLAFLKAGSSSYALDILKRAGVDLATPEPVEQTFAILGSIVDRLDKLIG